MGHLLCMAAHPKQPTRNQGPNPLPTYLCSQGPHRHPCSQPQAYPQKKRVVIHPLRGTDLCSRGGPRLKTQHHGRHIFSPGTTVFNLHEIRSSPRKSTPPPCLHPPLRGISRPRPLSKRERNCRPFLDHILLPHTNRGILCGRNRHSLRPLHSSQHPVLRGNPTHPSHKKLPIPPAPPPPLVASSLQCRKMASK